VKSYPHFQQPHACPLLEKIHHLKTVKAYGKGDGESLTSPTQLTDPPPSPWGYTVAMLEDPRAESRRMLHALEPWAGQVQRHHLLTARELSFVPRRPAPGRWKPKQAPAPAAA
jgi:hypothetical protein